MNFPWAISIAPENAAAIAPLRLTPGIEVSDAAEVFWLRGQRGDEQLESKLAALPACARYEWLALNHLRQIDRRIPSARLPDQPWQPLAAWLQAEMPVAAIPANEVSRVPLRLVRSTDEREPELLLTRLEELKQFAAEAARVRLNRLQFAANADGHVLVRGQPLPPLPGRRFVLYGCVAVPAGFSWQPAVGADVLARSFGGSGDALVIWNEDGTLTRLHGEQFVPATPSAVRASGQALPQSP
jgi:hypothetical protein